MFGMAENRWGGCVLVMFMYVVEYIPVLGVTDVGLSGLYSSSNKIHKLVCDMSLISHTFFFTHPPQHTSLNKQPHITHSCNNIIYNKQKTSGKRSSFWH